MGDNLKKMNDKLHKRIWKGIINMLFGFNACQKWSVIIHALQ